jgi:hypothetical protein
MFSCIRDFVTDFGTVTSPCCTCNAKDKDVNPLLCGVFLEKQQPRKCLANIIAIHMGFGNCKVTV